MYVDMVADLFHAGHVQFLRKVKSAVDNCWLIVGVHSDEEATAYKRKPICQLHERVALVSAMRDVDEVISGVPLKVTADFLDEHNVDLVAHGDDMTEVLKKAYSVPISRGIFMTVPYSDGISTSDIIQRIRDAYSR